MIAHRLRQPLILGYLLVGVAIGPHALGLVGDIDMVEATASIGVALLMLTLGLEVSFNQLRQVGKVGLFGGIAQILITFAFIAGCQQVPGVVVIPVGSVRTAYLDEQHNDRHEDSDGPWRDGLDTRADNDCHTYHSGSRCSADDSYFTSIIWRCTGLA